jgi:hypothetical protein
MKIRSSTTYEERVKKVAVAETFNKDLTDSPLPLEKVAENG